MYRETILNKRAKIPLKRACYCFMILYTKKKRNALKKPFTREIFNFVENK